MHDLHGHSSELLCKKIPELAGVQLFVCPVYLYFCSSLRRKWATVCADVSVEPCGDGLIESGGKCTVKPVWMAQRTAPCGVWLHQAELPGRSVSQWVNTMEIEWCATTNLFSPESPKGEQPQANGNNCMENPSLTQATWHHYV